MATIEYIIEERYTEIYEKVKEERKGHIYTKQIGQGESNYLSRNNIYL